MATDLRPDQGPSERKEVNVTGCRVELNALRSMVMRCGFDGGRIKENLFFLSM